jgi:hypothetical protein
MLHHGGRATALFLCLLAPACGNDFSSIVSDAAIMLLAPNWGRQGDRKTISASFPEIPPAIVAQSRFTSFDFGDRVFLAALDVGENGTIDVTLRIDPTAPLGRRLVRATLDTGRGSEIVATAEFVVLPEMSP